MFGRKKKHDAGSAARAALQDTGFDCALPGVRALRVDYDPSVWVRLPRPGEDRTDWAARHLAAYDADLGLGEADEAHLVAQRALDAAADTLLTHTCDLMALAHPVLGPGSVAYVDVLDQETGVLEHGEPEAFLTMADLRVGLAPARVQWYPAKGPKAWRTSMDNGTDPATGAAELLTRGHREVAVPGGSSAHLFASAFYARAGGSGTTLSLFHRAVLELDDGSRG